MPWVKLGLYPEPSRPGTPQDNSRQERMHLTLRRETLRPPAAAARKQQERFHAFQQVYNHERPAPRLRPLDPGGLLYRLASKHAAARDGKGRAEVEK